MVSTIAGLAGSSGSNDGTGSAARFSFPTGVAPDGAGNVYVADSNNHTIRKITAAGVVSTLAGLPGTHGTANGTGSEARFYRPRRVAVNHAGNIIVADTYNDAIRQVTPAGDVTTLAGIPGMSGYHDGPADSARFLRPRGLAVDSANNVYVADTSNNVIREVAPDGTTSTFAGSSIIGSADGPGSTASFYFPLGLALASDGSWYVGDSSNDTIRKINSFNDVTTFAGLASPGTADGVGDDSRFAQPQNIAIGSSGNLYVADGLNSTIRKVSPAGVVTTLAGMAREYGSEDGTGTAARFSYPTGVAVDSAENIFVADGENYTIRKITPGGVVTTFAGLAGFSGSSDGTGNTARFSYPSGVAVDNANNIFVADNVNQTIRKITPAGVVTTVAGSPGQAGSTDGVGSEARFYYPQNVAVDNAGSVYVADTNNFTIRKITLAGVVSTIAGLAGNPGSADGTGTAARFEAPWGIAVDNAGNVYVSDLGSSTIRKVTPAGIVTTLGGTTFVSGWNDATADAARFNLLGGIAVNTAGKLLIADQNNNVVRTGVPQLRLINVVSRKTHGAAGTFDISLPLTGTPGVECRNSNGNHTFVFTFSNNPVSANASVTGGVGSVTGSPSFAGRTMTINVTGATDAQKLTLTLNNTTDNFSQVLPTTSVSVNLLIGDTNGNGAVNASDISQTKTQSGTSTGASNFRTDVNLSGSVNASDVSLVKSHSGNAVPLSQTVRH